MNVLLCDIKIWAYLSVVVTDGGTDGQLSRGYTVRCISCGRTVIIA